MSLTQEEMKQVLEDLQSLWKNWNQDKYVGENFKQLQNTQQPHLEQNKAYLDTILSDIDTLDTILSDIDTRYQNMINSIQEKKDITPNALDMMKVLEDMSYIMKNRYVSRDDIDNNMIQTERIKKYFCELVSKDDYDISNINNLYIGTVIDLYKVLLQAMPDVMQQ